MIIIKNHGIQIKINLPEITDKNLLKLCVSEVRIQVLNVDLDNLLIY